jgi:hypothetical protein
MLSALLAVVILYTAMTIVGTAIIVVLGLERA